MDRAAAGSAAFLNSDFLGECGTMLRKLKWEGRALKKISLLLCVVALGAIFPALGEPSSTEVASQSKEIEVMHATGTFDVKTTLVVGVGRTFATDRATEH
jgi:hypothetical protein